MSSRHYLLTVAGFTWALATVPPAQAGIYIYPSGAYLTLQDAVDDAAASPDQYNYLDLGSAPIATGAEVVIGADFSAARQLVIRPDPQLAGVARAAVVSSGGTEPIFRITHATDVTLQDLDILRNSTNAAHLVVLDTIERVTVERCRIGSTWSTTGSAGMNNVHILYPTDVVIRNCLLFSRQPGNFAKGLYADGFTDPANSLFLYNNVVADFYTYGIHIVCGFEGVLLVLRNNVVLNHAAAPVEPVAYRSGVTDVVTVLTGANTAFASAANVETYQVGGTRSLVGSAAQGRLTLNRGDAPGAFMSRIWSATPAWSPNPDFYRLIPGGLLHNGAAAAGQTVGNGSPAPDDIAVVDDWERDGRPGGNPSHTDRGADQIEDGTLSATPQPTPAGGLRVTSGGVSARDAIAFRVDTSGHLACELFNLAGRRVLREQRHVVAGQEGTVAWPRGQASGVLLYRLTLTADDGSQRRTSGKAVLIR